MIPKRLDVHVRDLDIPTNDGPCDARFASPKAEGTFPGVLFLMDAFGLRPVIDVWIERIAAEGYAVLAPNLLYRSGRSPVVEDMEALTSAENRHKLFERLGPMMRLLTPEITVHDAGVYIDFLSTLPETKEGPVGLTGYCMGGRFALRAAAAYGDRVSAMASFHGGNLATEAEDSPHLLVGGIKGQVYVGHADNDASAPPEQQTRLAEALEAAGVPFQAELYVDAPHGWTMADTAAYRQEASEKHFERLIDLLSRTL